MAIDQEVLEAPDREASASSAGALWAGVETPALDAADLRIGGQVAIAMFAAGGALLPAIALPIREMVDPVAVVVIGAVSLAFAGAYAVLTRSAQITQDNLYAGDYAWIGLTACLVAATGGTSSPFFLLYPLAVLHAGAFQSRRRLIVVTAASILAFLTPVAYDTGGMALFWAMAIIAVPPTVVVAWSLNLALTTLRRQRQELAAAERGALVQARMDPLTGLGNYRRLWSSLEAQASRARRHDEQFSLIVLDLDGFKVINDEIGHREGDDALRAVATALRSGLRTEDICCRHGGDEFTVIAIGAGDAEARELASRLVEAVAEVPVLPDGEMRLGVTAGWSTFNHPARTAETLMRDADAMLRERKRGDLRPGAKAPELARATGDPPVLPASLARSLADARDETAVIEATIAHLAGALDAIAVTAVKRQRAELQVIALAGAAPEPLGDRSAVSFAAEALVARTAMVQEVEADARGVRSRLALPLLVGGEGWGALVLESARKDAYDESEQRIAVDMARQAQRGLADVLIVARLRDAGPNEAQWIADSYQNRASERRRLAEIAGRAGRALSMPAEEQRMLSVAAFLRDLGMAAVPVAVLDKPGPLTEEERAMLTGQAIAGERLLRDMPHLRGAARVVRLAHEHWDGGGYPDGLKGEAIPLPSRVLHACAVWVALTSPRPWRAALDRSVARDELRRMAGTQLDPAVVILLLDLGLH